MHQRVDLALWVSVDDAGDDVAEINVALDAGDPNGKNRPLHAAALHCI